MAFFAKIENEEILMSSARTDLDKDITKQSDSKKIKVACKMKIFDLTPGSLSLIIINFSFSEMR